MLKVQVSTQPPWSSPFDPPEVISESEILPLSGKNTEVVATLEKLVAEAENARDHVYDPASLACRRLDAARKIVNDTTSTVRAYRGAVHTAQSAAMMLRKLLKEELRTDLDTYLTSLDAHSTLYNSRLAVLTDLSTEASLGDILKKDEDEGLLKALDGISDCLTKVKGVSRQLGSMYYKLMDSVTILLKTGQSVKGGTGNVAFFRREEKIHGVLLYTINPGDSAIDDVAATAENITKGVGNVLRAAILLVSGEIVSERTKSGKSEVPGGSISLAPLHGELVGIYEYMGFKKTGKGGMQMDYKDVLKFWEKYAPLSDKHRPTAAPNEDKKVFSGNL